VEVLRLIPQWIIRQFIILLCSVGSCSRIVCVWWWGGEWWKRGQTRIVCHSKPLIKYFRLPNSFYYSNILMCSSVSNSGASRRASRAGRTPQTPRFTGFHNTGLYYIYIYILIRTDNRFFKCFKCFFYCLKCFFSFTWFKLCTDFLTIPCLIQDDISTV